ncbi:dTDP-4-amino-4,6-dideoxygalactose transaminase [Legionella israelensis]|uniref:dTDP-4-amino-4,6-dideoxygalactose transaminase n=1 Tax=Legionella israelensis TaxID=454 RepID=UPI00117D89C5|nr:dTDP-4-amino-4,6-dideoxygalactose transaminase [Legionella israelensis]QDP72376.1 dTDP-4-amino-4,6-dideoxygalactose transaminase [Legionella israelensis]
MISFNIPPHTGKEFDYMQQAVSNRKISGDGQYTKNCNHWIEENFNITKALLTTSCTHALEMAAILANIEPGDEIIAPSYTFVSTVNAFVLRGAKIKFIDVRPDTMNINEKLIEQAITSRTKAIVVVHYAGVACEMESILATARKYKLLVIEDAAQGVMAYYKNQALGSIGDLAAFSFHETKNYTMGEGGAILINCPEFIERAEIIREKGTDRSKFFRGEVDKYSWCDIGSSYLPSEMNAAYLWAQLEVAHEINNDRLTSWHLYYKALARLADYGYIELPIIPKECKHNGHIFYIKCADLTVRTQLIEHLKKHNIWALFHYIPLHKAKAGYKYAEFIGEDKYTTKESNRLLRLPLYFKLKKDELMTVVKVINQFFGVDG